MRQEIDKRIKITLDQLLEGGLFSPQHKIRIYNADHPMGRKGCKYLLAEYSTCQPPQKYIYETDEKGNVVYLYDLDSEGKRIPMLDSNGNIAYERNENGFILDGFGNRVVKYRKTPSIKGIKPKYKEYMKFKDCYVSHVYVEEYYDDFGHIKESGLAIQIFGGDLK